jgi:general secretion pathway protein I
MKYKTSAFTLLEVLIALAVIAISVTALLQSSSRDIEHDSYLKEQTLASRLALNTLHQIHVGLINPPYPPYENVETIDMADQKWYIVSKRSKIPNSELDNIRIEVREKADSKAIFTYTTWVIKL